MGFPRATAVTGLSFGLVSRTDGSAVTSGTVTGYATLDGGSQSALAGTPVHEGNGQWSVGLTAAEMDGVVVGLLFTHADALPIEITLRTDPAAGHTVDAFTDDALDEIEGAL